MAEASFRLERCRSRVSEEVKSKVLFLEVHKQQNGGVCAFEALDLNTGELCKTPFTLVGLRGIGQILSIGSVIYIIGHSSCNSSGGGGGYCQIHEGMSYFDMSKPEIGWKKAPYINERNEYIMPKCVSCCGKIFMFRSWNWSCFAEVFNPQFNIWTPLFDPPPVTGKFIVSHPVISDPPYDRIIIHFFTKDQGHPVSCIFAYYPNAHDHDRWECLVDNFNRDWNGPIVVVGDVIYFYYRKLNELIEAYDINTKQWLKVELSSEFDLPSKIEFRGLQHLGDGVLCLTTSCYKLQNLDRSIIKDHTLVEAVKFKVEPRRSQGQVLVTPLPFISSPLETFCHVYGYLAI